MIFHLTHCNLLATTYKALKDDFSSSFMALIAHVHPLLLLNEGSYLKNVRLLVLKVSTALFFDHITVYACPPQMNIPALLIY